MHRRLWLVDYRKKAQLSQKETASKVGIAYSFYNFIENGERRPSPEVAKKIAAVLGFEDEWYKLLEVERDNMHFLKTLRWLKDKKQQDVANAAGITVADYSMIETGKRRPSSEIAKKIAMALGFKDEWHKLL